MYIYIYYTVYIYIFDGSWNISMGWFWTMCASWKACLALFCYSFQHQTKRHVKITCLNLSTDTASSACCVYIGKCKRTWKAESWGSCNSTCGNGTRFRQVWCPFEEIFGPCDESSKPENSTKCRGDACPWSKDHFGNWSQCDNSCGAGREVQGLICQCPDDCWLMVWNMTFIFPY